jgi:hypothetical protein
VRQPPGRDDARSPGTDSEAAGTTRETKTSTQNPTTVYHYTILEVAAALACATRDHLTQELAEREQLLTGASPRELLPAVGVARWLAEELARLAAQEGGQS